MTEIRPARRLAAAGLAAALTLILAACGSYGASAPPATGAPPAATPAPSPVDVDGFVSSIATLDGTTATVTGFLLITGDQANLCSLVLESLPPQCGGSVIRVLGAVPQDVLDALDSTKDEPSLNQASWGDVTITGTVSVGDGATPTITIDSIENVTP
jgi:hypothetical protein